MGYFISLLIPRRQALVAALMFAGAGIAAGQTEDILHVFEAGNDGYYPETYPVVVGPAGNVYGTTSYGGGGNCTFGVYTGCGMIYQLTPPAQAGGAWTENIIWQFQGGSDGAIPGGLLLRNSKLYGGTGTGGSGACTGGCGYIFELTPPAAPGGAWTKTALYDAPTLAAECGITAFDAAGNYYGVGPSRDGNGSVCRVTPPRIKGGAWTEETLYVFKGVARGHNLGDGSGPLGVTFDSHGSLWGATASGGYCQRFQGGSCFGTLFELTPPAEAGSPWSETVVHRFSNLDQNPTSGVVFDQAGALYGITYVEVYRFTSGALTVIGTFDDNIPYAYAPTGGVVVDTAGTVFGVTAAGGQFGDGTVYKLTPPAGGNNPWPQTILHSFAGGSDGWNPEGPLTLTPNGALYGTTQIGGNQGCNLFGTQGGTGCGIVFEIVQ